MVQDFRNAGLDPADVAMMEFSEKMSLNAYKVMPSDIDNLREHGFSDAEILDIALTAAARNFFSKLMDALGAEPDERYLELEDSLREALVVGRPFGPPKEATTV
jgi:alkylhydroperoxidase family enzyme